MPAPKIILDLIARFRDNEEAYRRDYGETETRREFLDPFFKALGWDIDNTAGHAEAYKDVVHEDSVKVGVSMKAPDYSFRLGGVRKFFLEAKKPAVHVKEDPEPAFQLRRYAWSARLPLSILSNFNEFAVYDCRVKPAPGDKASTARVMYFTCADYAKHWDDIVAVFSKDALYKGSFDKFVAGKGKKGTAEVDDAFLGEIEHWRETLARNIALRNARLTQPDLNFAVQQTIDRIIFLRISEDRGIEGYGRLHGLLNGENTYARLKQVFHDADDRYNSGLFHFREEKGRPRPDELTLQLKIDDKALKDILRGLYYPESPYEFSVLPADILGQVYEQFLGKVIRLTAGGHAKVEDKPEVKKAGGVYYTPTYIVDYIVKQTVGKLLDGTTPDKAAKLAIVDPACGSGSFLLGAYQYLLNWHRDWYSANDPERYAKGRLPKVYRGPGAGWRLTTAERKRIVLNNIYGVDIDPQAVEVTKLSLLLKVLEEESGETLGKNWVMFHERALPDLDANIRCGNSLIGPDFFEGKLEFDDEERRRINAFDWESEFQEVFNRKGAKNSGGFDAVIGNPPYVRQESLAEFKDYFARCYEAFDATADLYTYFMERAVKLLRQGGYFSFIVSSSFLRTSYAEALRRTLKKHAAVVRIMDFGGLAIFANAKDTYVCIPLMVKEAQAPRVDVARIPTLDVRDLHEYASAHHFSIPHQRLSPEAWALKSNEEAALFDKVMILGKPLGEYVQRKMFYGLKTGFNEAFELTGAERAAVLRGDGASAMLIKSFLGGQDIRRYYVEDQGRHLIVIPSGWTRTEMAKGKGGRAQFSEREAWQWLSGTHPKIAEHLEAFAEPCRRRQDQGEYWWELRPCDYYDFFERPKIIFPDICKGPRFFLDDSGMYLANTAYCLGVGDLYLLGMLNSKLFWLVISNISIPFGVRAGQYRYRLIYQYMEKVPIRVIDQSDIADRTRHGKMVERVEQMLSLHKKLATAKTPHEKVTLERQIAATDREIDDLVYELYGLTEDEIKIVEASGTTDSAGTSTQADTQGAH